MFNTISNRRRLAASGVATLIGTVGALAGTASPARAESLDQVNGDELTWCVLNLSCVAVNDATEWAKGTAQWMYGVDSLHNGAGDAFRHCIWSGAIANRVGYDTAYTQVIAHEDISADPMNEVAMDITNDLTGLDIGIRSHAEGGDDTWGWIIAQCSALADNHELAGLDGVVGAY